MTTAQLMYILLLAVYAIMLLMFSRQFYWKYYAEKRYYGQRPTGLSEAMIAHMAHREGKEIPRFSVFVPARNEADVIEKTIDHLSQLNYSPDHYEVLIVTDEKEVQAAEQERAEVVRGLVAALSGDAALPTGEKSEAVLVSLMSRLALEEAQLAERKAGPQLSVREMLALSPHHRQQILQDISLTLLNGRGKIDRHRLCDIITRVIPTMPQGEELRLYPIFLSFAIPTVMAAIQFKKEQPEKIVTRLMTEAAQARQPLTQKVLTTLSETVSTRIGHRVATASEEALTHWLNEACLQALPTTQEIVDRKRMEFAAKRDVPALKHVVVPWDFDGNVDGFCTDTVVPSTKGRALNYAFRFSHEQSSMWAFWDAESRPNQDTLLYIAWRRLTVGNEYQIAQGPVYQVRNFWNMGPLCKIAGLFQSLSHEWNLPWLLQTLPFIGGTNMFMARDLMLKIGGFDHTVLTEDMELGARAWLKAGTWPDFVPYPSSEQTPPTAKGFYRQRLRWGSGYLQVYDKIKADETLPADRKNRLLRTYWWKGHLSWTVFQLLALLPIVVAALYWLNGIDPTGAPEAVRTLVALLSPLYVGFTIFCFFRYYRHMDIAPAHKRAFGFAQLFLLPISAFFLPVPYSSALVLKLVGRMPKGWVKTPRTKE